MIKKLLGLYRYRELLRQLVSRDIRLKYRRSFLGYLWSVLNPLGTMIVVAMIFAGIFRFDIPNYPAYLICGQVLFNFVTESTNAAIVSVTGNAPLLKKTYVPKYIFTISKVTSSLVNLLFAMVALLLVLLITGVRMNFYALFAIVVIGQLYLFCLGLGLFLAQAAVFFRDIQYIYGVLTTLWMYCTPIFYPIVALPENIRRVVSAINPLVGYLTQFRQVLIDGTMPPWENIGIGFLWAGVALLLGIATFEKNQDRFILFI